MKAPAIIVMTKVPGVADAKTRLRPVLSAEQCSSLASCFMQDTIANLEKAFRKIIVAFTPERGRSRLRELAGKNHLLIPQQGKDLGERLIAAIAEVFDRGFAPVIIIGTDSPTLPPEYLIHAIEYLQTHENGVTIGPTDDGGYYLIGLSKPQNGIFENIAWSTSNVFDQTIANIEKGGDLQLQILPAWYDVDEPDDLRRLKAEFETTDKISDQPSLTRRWFAENQINFDLASDGFSSTTTVSG